MNKKLALRASLQRGVSLVAVLGILILLGIVAAVYGSTRSSSADVLSDAKAKAMAIEVAHQASLIRDAGDRTTLAGLDWDDWPDGPAYSESNYLRLGLSLCAGWMRDPPAPFGLSGRDDHSCWTRDSAPAPGLGTSAPDHWYVVQNVDPEVCKEVERLATGQSQSLASGWEEMHRAFRPQPFGCHYDPELDASLFEGDRADGWTAYTVYVLLQAR